MSLPHRLEDAALAAAGAGVRALPWESAQRFGAGVGALASRLAAKRWRLTLDNLRAAFPGEPAERLEAWGREAWANLGRIGAECLWSQGRSAEELARHVRFEGTEALRDALRDGGALLHLGHFANWEVAGLAFSSLGFPLTVVARRIKNPFLDRRVLALRGRFGAQVLSHKNPFFGCARALKSGRCVGILMDQSLPAGGVFVPFFGRPAATTPLTAHLAHRTGAPVFALRLRREGSGIVGSFSGPVALGASAQESAAKLTAIIETWARERPGEWFWFHDRWKRSREAPKTGDSTHAMSPAEGEAG